MKDSSYPYYAWLIYDREGAAANQDYIRMHREIGLEYGIRFELLLPEEAAQRAAGLSADVPDFAIVRAIRPNLSENLEKKGIPVFNPAFVSRICNDKGRTIDYIRQNSQIPVVPTIRYERDSLSEALLLGCPGHIIKAVDGHGGKQVFRTSDPYDEILCGIGTSDFIIQPFVKGPGKDVRVYVIGREIIGAVERTAPDGFRSNFSIGGTVRTYELRASELQMVEEICGMFEFGMVGIDFILDEDGNFIFNEIEDVVGARMMYQCQPEVKLLEQYFVFILHKILH